MKKIIFILCLLICLLSGCVESQSYIYFNNLELEWHKKKIYIPLDEGDKSVLIQNQYAEKIRIRELSKTFRNGIVEIATYILGDASKSFILKTMKNIERGV